MNPSDTLLSDTIRDITAFLARELDRDPASISPQSRIIEDLGGDSLIFLEILNQANKRHHLNLEVRVVGRYLLKHPANTIGELAAVVVALVTRSDAILAELKAV